MNFPEITNRIKLFGISNQLIENELDRVEREFVMDFGRGHQKSLEKDQDYYPQIERDIRQEAEAMSKHYEIFYSLEKSIRRMIVAALDNAEPTGWWNITRIPQKVFDDTNNRIQREIDTGITRRSSEPIDFTNFGELGEIIKKNWDVFSDIFSSASTKAVERVLSNLNMLRGPIAHCSPLAEDEAVRLRLSVRDWFRLME